jgi:hypothetical protein
MTDPGVPLSYKRLKSCRAGFNDQHGRLVGVVVTNLDDAKRARELNALGPGRQLHEASVHDRCGQRRKLEAHPLNAARKDKKAATSGDSATAAARRRREGRARPPHQSATR